jgi:hypothetical protein
MMMTVKMNKMKEQKKGKTSKYAKWRETEIVHFLFFLANIKSKAKPESKKNPKQPNIATQIKDQRKQTKKNLWSGF